MSSLFLKDSSWGHSCPRHWQSHHGRCWAQESVIPRVGSGQTVRPWHLALHVPGPHLPGCSRRAGPWAPGSWPGAWRARAWQVSLVNTATLRLLSTGCCAPQGPLTLPTWQDRSVLAGRPGPSWQQRAATHGSDVGLLCQGLAHVLGAESPRALPPRTGQLSPRLRLHSLPLRRGQWWLRAASRSCSRLFPGTRVLTLQGPSPLILP